MTREPVDGVMCVVWTDRFDGFPLIARRGEHGIWTAFSAGGDDSEYASFHDSDITHWTTLDEAKAAPELVEVLRQIKHATDPCDETSYRADDREGCLDSTHSVATTALAKIGAKP
jgi:hypothetical protein